MSAATIHPGRVMMVGLPGPELDPRTADRLRELRPAGVILFGRNLDTPERTRELIDALGALDEPPRLVALDQEGGRVSRLRIWIGETPDARALARAGAASTERFGRVTAQALLALGFNVDFAPVVDLSPSDAANGIGTRSFAVDPVETSRLAGAFLDGLQQAGVAGCLKHFPGLGSTVVDSHERLPTDARTRDELDRADLVPYRRLGPRAASVMVGHGAYPALGGAPDRPASLSPEIVGGLLRDTLGYRGLVVTDDLEMGAVAPLDRDGEAAVAAVAAGCDLVLYCADLDRAARACAALARRAGRDAGFRRRLEDAASRVSATARRWSIAREQRPDWSAAREGLVAFRPLV